MEKDNFVMPWAKESSRSYDSWHSMCSYLGAFPAPLANYFIKSFSKEHDWIFDPFSGRGTTILESRILNRNCIATDLNPIAIALSESKNQNVNLNDIIERINNLSEKYDPALFLPEALAQPDEIHLIFHPKTLAQLCYLKRKILKSENPVDKFLIGCTLGVMHGGERKDGTSGYASISMPNTFSMSPEYVRRFVQTKELNREFRDIFILLKNKSIRLFEKHNLLKKHGVVLQEDVKKLSHNLALRPYFNKINLIVTSPPYLGIVNYAKQNWIRSWFLNTDPIDVSVTLDDDLNLNEWLSFSKKFIVEVKKFLKKDGVAVFVIGDVAKSKTSVIPLAREFCQMIKENNYFNNIWCINDVIEDTDKTTRIWGDTKGGATTIDRIVILSNINPFDKFINNNKSILDYNYVKNSTDKFLV